MELTLKNKIYISALFGAYLIGVELFFGAEKFLGTDLNFYLYCLIMLIISSSLELSFIQTIEKFASESRIRRILFSFTFLISSLITALIYWFTLSGNNGHFTIYLSAFLIASILPALLSILLFIFEDAKTTISAAILHTEESEENTITTAQTFVLENETGKQILKVTTDRLICFEANDNYVVTYYLDKDGNPKKSMDRCSLKKIDDILTQSGISFERVHKSYIVNPDYIDSIKGKSQAYKLQLHHFESLIPVSRSYDITGLKK